jgi:hypothetical protein
MTDDNVELLCEADVVYGGGRFSSGPKLFDQVYTFHAGSQRHMIPSVFCLDPCIEERAHILGPNLAPGAVQLDFERSAHNAVRTVLLVAHLLGSSVSGDAGRMLTLLWSTEGMQW